MKILYSFLALTSLFVLASCGNDNVEPQPRPEQFELYIDFWNPEGDNPQIRFDEENSSPEIKIDFSKQFEGIAVPPNLTNVIIENVRIIDENNVNYRIDQIDAYEFREDINDWKRDVEFIMRYDFVQDLAVVLVLDASASLGSDFETIKNYANDFIARVLASNRDAQIGIVSFSDQIGSFGPTNNQTALNSYIASIEQGPFTTLYEAMDVGIEMLTTRIRRVSRSSLLRTVQTITRVRSILQEVLPKSWRQIRMHRVSRASRSALKVMVVWIARYLKILLQMAEQPHSRTR